MLFLLGLPVIGAVALLWRYLQIYAPSNVLIRMVRSGPPHWCTAIGLGALAAALALALHALHAAIAAGAPGWLNLVVLVLAWDAVKCSLLGVHTGLRAVGVVSKRITSPRKRRCRVVEPRVSPELSDRSTRLCAAVWSVSRREMDGGEK